MDKINALDHKLLDAMGLKGSQSREISETDKNKQDFLRLFMTQLKNQDPMQPQEGSQFLGQLAQFSTVEGVQDMKKSFEELANSLHSSHALQASSLIGKKVQVNSNMGFLKDHSEGISGTIELPRSVSDLSLSIQDGAGQTIDIVNLGIQASGDVPFSWKGVLNDGTEIPAGRYQVKAHALVNGKQEAFKTYMFSNVDSVTLNRGAEGMILNVDGHGSLSLSEVKKIG